MKLLVFSDSHGSSREMSEVITSRHPDAEYVIHLGDGARDLDHVLMLHPRIAFVSVYGNCDTESYRASPPELERTLDLGCVRIFMCHGHRRGVRSGIDELARKARAFNADIVLYGHTHRSEHLVLSPECEGGRSLTVINPGSISRPRGGVISGKSYAVITLNADNGWDACLLPF